MLFARGMFDNGRGWAGPYYFLGSKEDFDKYTAAIQTTSLWIHRSPGSLTIVTGR